ESRGHGCVLLCER
nr:immunoglobulin heavy chain junction region [Homo sapiens]